jgi:hypothetical protein
MAYDVIDGIVIDKVFQPISDALYKHASCFKISNFLLDGMPLIAASLCWQKWQNAGNALFCCLLFAGIAYYYWVLKQLVRRFERSCKPDTTNAARYMLCPIRLFMILLLLFDVTTSLQDPYLILVPNFLALSAIYFSSCRHNTRAFKKRFVQHA